MKQQQFENEIIPLKDKIYRLSLFLLENTAEAEDVTQEVFLKLWRMKGNLDVVENKQAYILRMTRNACLDRIRVLNRMSAEIDIATIPPIEKKQDLNVEIDNRDMLRFVGELIKTLPEVQRTIISLRDIEGMEYEEIANITGMTENAVKVNLSRARKKIREKIKNIK